MDSNSLVSMIVPVYNSEKYLRRCIDSIVSQTYRNIEIILVDDGSTDQCGVICDEYAKADSRITVIHKENEGPSSARNTGIDICHGEFISFVDSDDFVSHKYIENLYDCIHKYNADISLTPNEIIFQDSMQGENAVKFKDTEYETNEISNYKALKLVLYQRVSCGMYGKIYRRSIFDGLRGPAGSTYAEDLAVLYNALMKANKIVVVNTSIYAMRLTPGSLVRKKSDYKKIKSAVDISQIMYEDICNYDLKLKRAAASRAFSMNYNVLLLTTHSDVQAMKELWNEIKKYRVMVLTDMDPLARIKDHVGAAISFFGMNFAWVFGKICTQKVKHS